MTMPQLSRRQLIGSGAVAGAATIAGSAWTFPKASARTMAADSIRLGFISCGGKASSHMSVFKGLEGCEIAALCDPDGGAVDRASRNFPKAKTYKDLRKLIDDKDIDAVVVATTNHWHCLASIWAMEAGKDVYVEKPLSHTQWEGDQTVNAARRYNRICQLGTQQRSDPMQAEIKKFLHQDEGLGKLTSCRVNRYGVRGSIGKRKTQLPIADNVDYDLWLGPAEDQPIYRNKLQYDWHWDYNTGSGEMGNWGVHILDDVRNVVFQDEVSLPSRVMAAGGRVAWGDAGNTPNVHFAYFDTGEIPTVVGLTNLRSKPGGKGSPECPGPGTGYVVYCEGGRYEGERGKGAAFDNNGKKIREFRGDTGNIRHQQNFLDAVRSRDAGELNAEVEVGNLSTGWSNMANIAFKAGDKYTAGAAADLAKEIPTWGELAGTMETHLAAHSVKMSDLSLSPMLEYDVAKAQFHGAKAEQANGMLKRKYRPGYVVPEISPTA